MAQFKNWRETNALVMVADLVVDEINVLPTSFFKYRKTNPEKIDWSTSYSYLEARMEGYYPDEDSEELEGWESLAEFESQSAWWDQFDIEARVAKKPTNGGLEEKEHPWSELRKYAMKGVETLQDTIQAGKDAEKMLAKVKPNISNLNKMCAQEAEQEEAKLQRMVK